MKFPCAQGFKMHFSNSIADCYGAVEVLDYNNDSRVQFPGDFGQYDEFEHFYAEHSEVNSVWLRLEPNLKGQFEFEIYTENNVDFGYYLFKANNNSFCEELEKGTIEPIRYSTTSYHKKGTGGDYKPHVEVDYDDVYYLMIHTNSTYKGRIRVAYRRIGDVQKTTSVIQDYRDDPNDNFVRVKIRDADTGDPVEANIIFNGIRRDNDLFLGTDFIFSANLEKELFIESNTPGYFLYSKVISTEQMRDKNSEILIELERLGPGKKLALEDIKFEQNSDVFMPIALPALKRLMDFLALNDEIKIEIQGHVNAPGVKNNLRIQNLSESRARAVKKFLKDNGIDANRMTVVGYGNLHMKYEEPTEPWQEEANRRVEIMIIDEDSK
ncbi:MAG: OmpA family protein [Flavobacteriales bacterium]|nr:OmpA family protein [Flavobacteriales bacterium]